jgi:membrane-bound lytic murein transglycosylase B
MNLLRRFRIAVLSTLGAVLAALPGAPASAQSDGGFQAYLQLLAARARAEGVSEATIIRMTSGLTVNPRVIQLDRAQPGGPPTAAPSPFAPYRRQHVDADRIYAGRAMYSQVVGLLPRIEATYGVPGKILLAIWGHETHYGRLHRRLRPCALARHACLRGPPARPFH